MAKSKFALDEVLKKVEQTKRTVPKLVANLTQNYFVKSWTNQGFDNIRWQQVKRRIAGTPEFKYPKNKGLSRRTKPILVGSGALRRAVANSVVVANWNEIKLVVDKPYADVHNEGTNKIPKRQFVGQTEELTKMQIDKVEKEFDKIWN